VSEPSKRTAKPDRTPTRRPNLPPLSYNVNDACQAIGIGRTKMYELIKRGELQTFTLDGRTLIRADVLRAFVDRLSHAA
jgi:hypothetical protein